ncbi:hypothetical protein GINT2_002211 [Glugoides intestinalis]
MRFSIVLIASTLISCYFFTEKEELKKLKELEEIYGKMPTNEKERVGFAKDIDSILNSVNLENSEVFNKFAPFLLYSANHNEKLKDMDLRLVYESNNENIKEHWKINADEIVKSLRFTFNVEYIYDDVIEFCKNFSKLTKVELRSRFPYSFNKSKTWSNSMKVLKKIPTCTEVELRFFKLDMLKDFIDGAAKSKSEVLKPLEKLKIVFDDNSGIRSLNSAVGKFPYLFKYLPKLSEITIENEATTYTPSKDHKSGNLVKLIKELPKDITINLIGRFVESNQGSEIFNALKKTPDTVKVSIVYKLDSFDKEYARILRDKIEDPKLNIKIFSTRNGIERHLPITTEILDNFLKAKDFYIYFDIKKIEVEHTNVNDFLSSFSPFLEGWECERVIYIDEKPRTEICELPEFVETFNKCKSIRFIRNFLDFKNENDTNGFISVVNKRDERLVLYSSVVLIDSENLITIYNKMQEKRNFTLEANSWLIRLRKGKVGAFKDKFKQIYEKLYPGGLYQNEFLEKIEALSKLSELDVFTINLRNKDVLYIGDKEFDPFLQVLKTIKNMFKKVIVAKDAFTKDQIKKLRAELRKGGTCTLETGTEESLLNPWLKGKSYLIRLFLWLKPIFRYYS